MTVDLRWERLYESSDLGLELKLNRSGLWIL